MVDDRSDPRATLLFQVDSAGLMAIAGAFVLPENKSQASVMALLSLGQTESA